MPDSSVFAHFWCLLIGSNCIRFHGRRPTQSLPPCRVCFFPSVYNFITASLSSHKRSPDHICSSQPSLQPPTQNSAHLQPVERTNWKKPVKVTQLSCRHGLVFLFIQSKIKKDMRIGFSNLARGRLCASIANEADSLQN